MLAPMARRPPAAVVNRLPILLGRYGMSWGELERRTLLPPRLLARLRVPGANPRLVVAERIAAALGVPVEAVGGRRRPGCGTRAPVSPPPPAGAPPRRAPPPAPD